MKIGLACVETKPQDMSFNINQVVNLLMVAKKHQVDLVLFGKDFLGNTSLTHDAQALFQLKIASTYYDVAIGMGYIEDDQSNYIIIDESGNIRYNHLTDQEFVFKGQTFSVVLGDQGFKASETNHLLLWPILTSTSEKDWFNHELSRYRTQANLLAKESILVNSFVEEVAYGGAFHLKDNVFVVNQPMGQKGLSILEI